MIQVYKTYQYIIENNEISLWAPEDNPSSDAPILFQPTNPSTGRVFESEEDAQKWIEEYVENMFINPVTYPFPLYVLILAKENRWEELSYLSADIKNVLPEDIKTKLSEWEAAQESAKESTVTDALVTE